ncbi:hypothetical protein ACLB2K_002668 [Fragaria x ananassa]
MGSGQSLLSVFAPNTRKDKRKRADQLEKECKRQRTAVVDVVEEMIQPDAVASGCQKRKRGRGPDDDAFEEESNKRTKHNMFDKVDEGRKIHQAMRRLMSVVDVDSRLEDLIRLSNDEVEINQAKCVEYLNKTHDRIIELQQKKSLKKRKANWSELPNELLESILKKLIPSEFDMVGFKNIRHFKAVCQSWRGAAKSYSSNVLLPQTPCLVLHEQAYSLFDPVGKKVHEISHKHFPHASFVGSSYGWIVMFYEEDYLQESKAHLFNPITRVSIPIPGIDALPDGGKSLPSRAVISSNPSFNNNFVVVVEYGQGLALAYYKHGEKNMSWTMLTDDYGEEGFVFHDDLLVASSDKSCTAVWDFKEYPPLQRSPSPIDEEPPARNRVTYLTKSLTGEILRLGKRGGDNHKYETINFRVEKLNLAENKWEILQSLGDQSLFLFTEFNEWQLMSLPNPCFLGCERNSIYFRTRELNRYAIYNLEKGKVESMGEESVVIKAFGEESVVIKSFGEESVVIKSFGEDVNLYWCYEPLWIVPNPW